MRTLSVLAIALALVLGLAWGPPLFAQSDRGRGAGPQHGGQDGGHSPGAQKEAEEEDEGEPKDWKFSLPAGDPARGRRLFARLECYSCHAVKGERFPTKQELGPELSHMGTHHSAEFIAESIMNPNAVIDPDPAYRGPDGSSRMPSFNHVITVQELIDLVAFIKNLKPPSAPAAPGQAPADGGHKH